jgi:hypothetical protein
MTRKRRLIGADPREGVSPPPSEKHGVVPPQYKLFLEICNGKYIFNRRPFYLKNITPKHF